MGSIDMPRALRDKVKQQSDNSNIPAALRNLSKSNENTQQASEPSQSVEQQQPVSQPQQQIPDAVPPPLRRFTDIFSADNLLDRDLASTSAVSLLSANNKPASPLSLTGFNQQQASKNSLTPSFDDTRQAKIHAVKNDPDQLRDYRKKRLSQLDESINNLQAKRSIEVNPHDIMSVGSLQFGEVVNDNELADQIKQQQEYKDGLQKSIADAAAVAVPKTFYDKTETPNIEEVGKKFLETVGYGAVKDDERVLSQLKDAKLDEEDKSIAELTSQTIRNRLYKEGSAALSAYHVHQAEQIQNDAPDKIKAYTDLVNKQKATQDAAQKAAIQTNIDALLADPTIKSFADNATSALRFADESNTSSRLFPQVQREEKRQQLNDIYFAIETKRSEDRASSLNPLQKVRDALSVIMGEDPTDEDIKTLSKESGIPEGEVKSIVNDGKQGFFGKSSKGVRVSGALTGISQAADETLASSIMGLRRIFNSDNVDSKNAILSTKSQSYNQSASQNTLYDAAGNLNFNPFSIANTAGRGIGQMAIFAAPTMVTGGLAEGLLAPELRAAAMAGKDASIASGVVKGAEMLATHAAGYIGSYESAYKDIAAYTDDEDKRRGYANIVAHANAGAEHLMSPADIAKKIGIGAVSKEALIKTFIKDAEKFGVQETVGKRLFQAGLRMAEVAGAENIEEQATNLVTNAADEKFMSKTRSASELADQFWQTLNTTTVNMLPMMVGAGMNGMNDMSNIRKEGLFEVGNEPDAIKARLKNLFDSNALDQGQFNTRTSIVNTMQDIVGKVNNLTKKDGTPLSYDEKVAIAAQQFRISHNNKIKSNGAIEAQAAQVEGDTKDAIAEQQAIIDDAPLYKVNGKVVNAKEAMAAIESGDASNFIEIKNDPELFALLKEKGSNVVEAPAPEVKAEPTIQDVLDKKVLYNGMSGIMVRDGMQYVFQQDNSNREFVIEPSDNYESVPVTDLGIHPIEESAPVADATPTLAGENTQSAQVAVEPKVSPVTLNDDNSFTIRGEQYLNKYSDPFQAINRDADGNVVSVNLDTQDGGKRTFRGDTANDIAYQMTLKEITKDNATRDDFEQFINTDEQSAAEIRSADTAPAVDTGAATETAARSATQDNGSVSTVAPEAGTSFRTTATGTGSEVDGSVIKSVSPEILKNQEPPADGFTTSFLQQIPKGSSYVQELRDIKTGEVLIEGSLDQVEAYKKQKGIGESEVTYYNPFTKTYYSSIGSSNESKNGSTASVYDNTESFKEAFDKLSPEDKVKYGDLIANDNHEEAHALLTKNSQAASVENNTGVVSSGVSVADNSSIESLTKEYEKEPYKVSVIKRSKIIYSALTKLIPNIEIHLHRNAASMDAALASYGLSAPTAEANFSFGSFKGNQVRRIDINLEKAKLGVVAHEATHAVLYHIFGNSPSAYKSFKEKIQKIVEKSTDQYLNRFVENYSSEDVKPEEYLAELSAVIQTNDKAIKPTVLHSIKKLINVVTSKALGRSISPETESIEAIKDFFVSMNTAFKKGDLNAKELIGKANKVKSAVASEEGGVNSRQSLLFDENGGVKFKEKGATAGINELVSDVNHPIFKPLYNWFATKYKGDKKIHIFGGRGSSEGVAFTDNKNKFLAINKNHPSLNNLKDQDYLDKVIAHEIIHAIIFDAIGTNKRMLDGFNSDLKGLAAILNSQDISELDQDVQDAIGHINNGNPEELVAYALTDTKLAQYLDTISVERNGQRSTSVWGKIKDLIAGILFVKPKSLLDAVVNTLDSYVGDFRNNSIFYRPDARVGQLVKEYVSSRGETYTPPEKISKLDTDKSRRIADAYEAMKHDPTNPEVIAAYTAMANETVDQYKLVSGKYDIDVYTKEGEPYHNSKDMVDDLINNNHLFIFATESGFGEGKITDEQRAENPLLATTEFKDKNGVPLLVNDLFRAVHDIIGHGELGNSFGAVGEENAWMAHSRMYSPIARRAMTTETRGQNSWVNFSGSNVAATGKISEGNRLIAEGKKAEGEKLKKEGQNEFRFADQKIGLLPNWVSEDADAMQSKQSLTPLSFDERKKRLDTARSAGALSEEQYQKSIDKALSSTGTNREEVLTPEEQVEYDSFFKKNARVPSLKERISNIAIPDTDASSPYSANKTFAKAGFEAKGRPAQGNTTTIPLMVQANVDFINQLVSEGADAIKNVMEYFGFTENQGKLARDFNMEGVKTLNDYRLANVLFAYLYQSPLSELNISPEDLVKYTKYLKKFSSELGREIGQSLNTAKIRRVADAVISDMILESTLSASEYNAISEAEDAVVDILSGEGKMTDEELLASEDLLFETELEREKQAKQSTLLERLLGLKGKEQKLGSEISSAKSQRVVDRINKQMEKTKKDIKDILNKIKCD